MAIRFGAFEFSREARRLTRNGQTVRLTGQPLELLMMLTDTPGRLVTRDEIRTRLWPTATVEFDHSLDVAMNRLRAVLSERGREAVFIETLPRVGYRFVVSNKVAEIPPAPARHILFRAASLYGISAFFIMLIVLFVLVHQHYGTLLGLSRAAR